MIWNGVSSEERLLFWKDLRKNLSGQTLEYQLLEISKFYASTPFGARSVDYYDPQSWPTPWEILFYGSFCKSSISLMIFYTVVLLSPQSNIDLYLVDDSGEIYLLPVIDNQFVLNYIPGVVSKYSEIQNTFEVLQVFSKNQVKTIT